MTPPAGAGREHAAATPGRATPDGDATHTAGALDTGALDTGALDAGALYRALLDSHPEPTFALGSDGALTACNRAFAAFVGRPASALRGADLAALVLEPQRPAVARALASVLGGSVQSWRVEFRGPDETVSIAHVTLAPARVGGRVVGAQGVARDVTVYQVIEEQLQARVFTDPLTGLANRTHLHEAIGRALRRADAPARVAVLFVDLDDFKQVNDALGHAAGDALLVAAADRLRRAIRGVDLAARLGGDEFAVLLEGVGDGNGAAVLAARVQAALREPVEVNGKFLATSASLGIAHWDGVATPAELLRNADLAMYRAKVGGKGRHAVYNAQMHAMARDRLELASDLREAVHAGAITAAFQPIVDLATGRVVKAEALARWSHPVRGAVPPNVFVPLAEEVGLIDELGALMLRHACGQLRRWPADVGVTVNVSGGQVDRETMVAAVRAALAESGADPRRLTLELTESVAMRRPERLLPMLAELASEGVTLAIDDFGTGYSSLSYLHRFPVSVLKIDKSFIDGLGARRNPQAETLARTIVTMAGSLGLRTVAEGVETAAQRNALRMLGCELGQGYLFGRPGDAAAVALGR